MNTVKKKKKGSSFNDETEDLSSSDVGILDHPIIVGPIREMVLFVE